MYDSFEEYASIMGITKSHPNYEAYKIIWNMSRTPASVLKALTKSLKKGK